MPIPKPSFGEFSASGVPAKDINILFRAQTKPEFTQVQAVVELTPTVYLTLAGGVLAGNAGSTLLLLSKEASDGGLDALLLGCFVEGVLAAVTTAGVTTLAVLQANQTGGGGAK